MDIVAREGLSCVLQRKALGSQPQSCLPLGKSFLPVDPPVSEPGIAQRVEGARKAGREECSVQILLAVTHSGDPAENLLWRASTVFALAVGPVALLVVVLNPPFMNGHELGPALGPCEVPVGHPALDVEGGLYVRLPRTTPLYLFLVDVQGFVDRECLVGPEDGPAVGDDGFGRAVALHRRVKDREVRREILAAKDPTCEDRPAVVLQNRIWT